MQDSHDDIAGEDHEQLIDFPQTPTKLSALRKLTRKFQTTSRCNYRGRKDLN